MKVSAQYAQEHFPDLVDAAYSGEPVEIAVPDKPALFLAPRVVGRKGTPSGRPRAELLGAGEGSSESPPMKNGERWIRNSKMRC